MNQPVNEWKDKYLESLADLEKKDQHWQSIEFSLRKCISRLSFIGDGRDAELDEKLETLRNRVRGEQDIEHLLRMIEGITRFSDSLSSATGQGLDHQQLSEQLLPLLQVPPFPAALKGQVKGLARKMKKGEMSADLLQECLSLIKEGLTQGGAETGAGTGLLSRIFARPASGQNEPTPEPEDARPETVPEQVPARHPPQAQPAEQSQELHALAREILVLLVRKLDAVEGWSQPLLPFLGRIDQAPTAAALLNLTDELAGILAPSDKESVPADKALLQLLDQLDLAGESRDQINALQARLQKGVDEKGLPEVLEQIASLVGQVRQRAEVERQEVERFLLQLTERLQALDSELLGVDQQGRQIIEESIEFGEAVQGDMSDLHAHVEAANDLDELKLTISERIVLIQERLRQHRHEEENRAEQLEQHIGGLKARLDEVEKESSSLKKSVIEARKRAFKDALTGLNNRHAFDTRMDEEFSRWSRYDFPMSMLVLDIDNFKKINDTYGHKAGDKVLKVVGGLLQKQVRKADFSARYGGEEFVVLLPEIALDDAWQVAEKIRSAIEKKGFHSGEDAVTVTVSCGIAQFQKGDTPESAFNRADTALYHAKGTGKNKSCTEKELNQ